MAKLDQLDTEPLSTRVDFYPVVSQFVRVPMYDCPKKPSRIVFGGKKKTSRTDRVDPARQRLVGPASQMISQSTLVGLLIPT